MALSFALAVAGIAFLAPIVAEYRALGLALARDIGPPQHMAITGLLLVLMSFTNFVITLLVHAASAAYGKAR
jgi:hypothetical protein